MVECWLDCDPGIDDMFALIMAAFSPKINLIGVSTVSGNSNIKKMTRNTLNVMNLCGLIDENLAHSDEKKQDDDESTTLSLSDSRTHGGLHLPLIEGCGRPILGDPINADNIHGEAGLPGDFPPLPNHAVSFVERISSQTSTHFTTQIYSLMKRRVNETKKKITILAIGPLTNVACLLLNYPDVTQYIEKIVFMGGAIGLGNITALAEFNMHSDPVAGAVVCQSGLDLHMIPLEPCFSAIVTDSFIAQQSTQFGDDTQFSEILNDILVFFHKAASAYAMKTPILIDPVASFFLVEPDLFETKLVRVDVETGKHALNYGQTICDLWNSSKKAPNVNVCIKLKSMDLFWQQINKTLIAASANRNSRKE